MICERFKMGSFLLTFKNIGDLPKKQLYVLAWSSLCKTLKWKLDICLHLHGNDLKTIQWTSDSGHLLSSGPLSFIDLYCIYIYMCLCLYCRCITALYSYLYLQLACICIYIPVSGLDSTEIDAMQQSQKEDRDEHSTLSFVWHI